MTAISTTGESIGHSNDSKAQVSFHGQFQELDRKTIPETQDSRG